MWTVNEKGSSLPLHLSRWQELAQHCHEPSHNQPELIVPLLAALPEGRLATVEKNGALALALPVMDCASWRGLKANWITPLCFMGSPCLDQDKGQEALQQFLAVQTKPLLLQSVTTTGPLWQCLSSTDHKTRELRRWQRAVLRPEGSFDQWFAKNFERKRRKEYRRLESRLSEQGTLEKMTLPPAEAISPWVETFLELESRSWKGQRHTDLAHDSRLAQATIAACESLAQAGKLRFWKLLLNGKTIASLFAMVDGDRAWLGKISYDAAFAKFSPGVLLILYATEQLMAEKTIRLIDSCAIPNHPMIDHIWRDRLEVADIMIAPASMSAFRFGLAVQIEKTHRLIRSVGREIYYKLRKGKNRS